MSKIQLIIIAYMILASTIISCKSADEELWEEV